MGRKPGYCGNGRYKVRSYGHPVFLLDKLKEYVAELGLDLSETTARAIAAYIGLPWETVIAENERKYPGRGPI